MPLLGERTVLAYGYTRKEAINNLYPVLTSTMYKSGELDTVFEGTAASRKLIAIYEQAAEYGLYPRFKLSMSNDQPGAHYQITLSVPEWNVKVLASAPRYVEALSEAIDSYQEKVKKRDVKQKISPDVTASRMKDLKAATAYHALNYILQKLNIKNLGKQYDQLKTAGPQHKYSIRINGKLANADVPMIRRDDAPRMAWLTAAVTILQRYGFDAMDGFSEHFVANKSPKPEPTRPRVKPDIQAASQFRPSLPEQRAIDQPGQDADSKDGHLMGHLYGSLKEGLEEDAAEGMSDAQDRGSRHGVRYSWHK
ncbi:hypothetical protein D6C93_00606 [Aureobasidium pullulans]|nr:hypothetical protein D6C93_00606 [Aureobasidium pullulans]